MWCFKYQPDFGQFIHRIWAPPLLLASHKIHSAFYCGYDCTKLCPLGLHAKNMSFLSIQVVNILHRAMCGLPLAKSHNNRKFTHVDSLLFYLAADPQNLLGFVYAPEHLSRFFMLLFSCLGIFYRVLN